MRIDAVIFGGGIAGLWLLDELTRRGTSAVLLEAGQLGSGQTIASQGILHGGLKYTLEGMLTGSAIGIRDMPALWRECLAGRSEPDLSATRVRSPHCFLWRTETVASKLGMIGAKVGLRVAPTTVAREDRPGILTDCPGTVARLDEPVISPASLLSNFAMRHRDRILHIDAVNGLEWETAAPGQVTAIAVTDLQSSQTIRLSPERVIFTAGAGNAQLRERVGLTSPAMQRRPLHMTIARGPLPELNGHCIDGRKTRVTVTSDIDSENRCVWQIGGQVSEDGVDMPPGQLIAHVQTELRSVIPGLNLADTEWSTYRVDRAERLMKNNRRPETSSIIRDGNTITAWPTKLVLAPHLAMTIAEELQGTGEAHAFDTAALAGMSRPEVATPPWDGPRKWSAIHRDDASAA